MFVILGACAVVLLGFAVAVLGWWFWVYVSLLTLRCDWCYMYEFGVSLFCVAVLRCCHVNSVGHVRSDVVLVIRLF